ncbi:MAG: PH domain-containing protein [Bacteroidota bacterium]
MFRKITTIPFNRVQHCEIKQGPIERLFNLKTLEVYTAGGATSDLKIPGLPDDRAQELKDFIITQGSHSNDESE